MNKQTEGGIGTLGSCCGNTRVLYPSLRILDPGHTTAALTFLNFLIKFPGIEWQLTWGLFMSDFTKTIHRVNKYTVEKHCSLTWHLHTNG